MLRLSRNTRKTGGVPLALLTLFLLVAATAVSASAQTAPAFPFTFYIHDTTGVAADTPFPSIYQFPSTSLGSNSHVVLKVVNTSNTPAVIGAVIVTASTDSAVANTNFTVSPIYDLTLPVGGSNLFTLNFSPTTTGPITAYMQTSYQVQENGCDFTSEIVADQCPSGLNLSATLTGMATAPQLVLSYESGTVSTTLQPSGTPLNFGNVSTSGSSAITFTLSNDSSVSVNTPSISVPPPTVYSVSPFLVDVSQMPAAIAAGSSATFTITYEPGQTGLSVGFLLVGANSYPIQGAGVIIADIDALQISYVDNTGVRTLPQAATPISFGQVVAGTSGTSALTFTVTNPTTSYNAIAVSTLSVVGTSFAISQITGATAFPASVNPGAALTFVVTFTPAVSGTATGTLNVGARSFSLTGVSINSPLPSFSLAVNPSPLNSQEQATVAVQFTSPSPLNLVGTIAVSFTPSVTGVTDDPGVMFLATSGRTLSISVASGAQTATYKGQSTISFQTGTTAGTIQFTVAFPNTPSFKQSFTITPSEVQITSASAVRSDPNLIVTFAGYDNTYSAGALNFTFYDTSGHALTPIAVNAAGSFQSLFFGSGNTAGGAFSLQATFPVTGDVTQIGSVAVTVNNSTGQSSTTQNFQ